MTSTPRHSPDWDHVPFAVGCARCGHDLRGQSDPTCPQCQLEFDWAVAVPIEKLTCETCDYHLYGLTETRCPECGESFTWDGALVADHRKRIPRFEYQWRRRPVRSLISTWFHALRPGKFWRSVDIHDPPRVGALCGMVALMLVAFAVEVGVLLGVNQWTFAFVAMWRSSGVFAPPTLTEVFPVFLMYHVGKAFSGLATWSVLRPIIMWLAMSFITLLLFPQSMRRFKVQVGQVVRVWAHAIPMAFPVPFLLQVGYVTCCISFDLGVSEVVVLLIAAFIPIHIVWSLRCGYGRYLQMDHGLGIAIASQAIAALVVTTIEVGLVAATF